MIHTSKQLKDKVRNISHGDNQTAQMLIRNFIMERFLERVSISPYRNNFILKGGMLLASLVGIDTRATMDIDSTLKALPLNEEDAVRIVNEIIRIHVEDGISFEIVKAAEIMADFEYPGVRLVLEDRSIELMTYTPETLLAEKIQTILARGITTTRMRDYYDVYEIVVGNKVSIDKEMLAEAFTATCMKRKTIFGSKQIEKIVNEISTDEGLLNLWDLYKNDNFYVGDIKWTGVCEAVCAYIRNNISK